MELSPHPKERLRALQALQGTSVPRTRLIDWLPHETSSACLVSLFALLGPLPCNVLDSINSNNDEEVQKAIVAAMTEFHEPLVRKLPIHLLLPCTFEWTSPESVLAGLTTLVLPALGHKRSTVRKEGLRLADILIRKFPFQTTYPIVCALTGKFDNDNQVNDGLVKTNYLGILLFDPTLRQELFALLTAWCFDLQDSKDIDWCLAPFLLTATHGPKVPDDWVRKMARRYMSCLLKDITDFGACTDENRLLLLNTTLGYLKEHMTEYLPELCVFLLRRRLPDIRVMELVGEHCDPQQWWPFLRTGSPLIIRTLMLSVKSWEKLETIVPEIIQVADSQLLDLIFAKAPQFGEQILIRRLELGQKCSDVDDKAVLTVFETTVTRRFEDKLDVQFLCSFATQYGGQFSVRLVKLIVPQFDRLNQLEKQQILDQILLSSGDRTEMLIQLVLTNQNLLLPLLCEEKELSKDLFTRIQVPHDCTMDDDNVYWWIILSTRAKHYSKNLLILLIAKQSSLSARTVTATFGWLNSCNTSEDLVPFIVPLYLRQSCEARLVLYEALKGIISNSNPGVVAAALHRWELEGFIGRSILLREVM